MRALLGFILALLASPFKSRSRFEVENAALRQQLIVVRRLWRPVKRRLRAKGIRDKPIARASPWQNGFAERLIWLDPARVRRSRQRLG
jgi:hypothetical protein